MENKYYTPDIEEFHVGFEFEFHGMSTGGLAVIDFGSEEIVQTSKPNIKIWNKEVLDEKTNPLYPNRSLPDIKNLIDNKQIRVKYLDQEDIESFGFEFDKTNGIMYWYKWEDVHTRIHDDVGYMYRHLYLTHDAERKTVIIKADISDGTVQEKFFEGQCRNKSELRRLLQQLNII